MTDVPPLAAEIDRLRAEIARLQAPPVADAMDAARRACGDGGMQITTTDFITAIARAITAARRAADAAGYRRGVEDADAIFHKLWTNRAADGTDQFTCGLLAGMTELMNAIRALATKEQP